MLKVKIKTEEEIALMREAGRILALVHQHLQEEVRAGMSTWQVDKIGEECIRSYGCTPSFLGLYGYPASVCVSVNDEVVHGIPSKKRILHDGDIVSLDTGVIYRGYHSDAARTLPIGEISQEAQDLIDRTRMSFFAGMKYATAHNRLYDISRGVNDYARSFGYGVVRDLTGHGVGSELHEDPPVPNFRKLTRGMKLQPGMTIAVEPMINLGTRKVYWMDDDWTVKTRDGLLSAHYENTILITDGKPELFTLTEEEKAAGYLELF